MRAEEKFAVRFLEESGIRPPYDVRSVVEDLATIEEDIIPGSVDAVLIRESARTKPLIILQGRNPTTRQTFTLGHELGHLVIPWHVGTILCHVAYGDSAAAYLYEEIEGEANRFASEVLMPRAWLKTLRDQSSSIADTLHALSATGVSPLAASFALIRSIGPGYVFVETDPSNNVTYRAQSEGTAAMLPTPGIPLAPNALDAIAVDRHSLISGSMTLRWWKLADRLDAPDVSAEERSGSELLEAILADVSNDPSARKRMQLSINGIVGAANSTRRNQALDLYTTLRTRFLNRSELRPVVDHPLFDAFLARKSSEITSRDVERRE